MKNLFVACLLAPGLLFLSACGDDDLSPEAQLAEDIDKIENYLTDNNLMAESTASGLHYIIEEEGTGTPHTDSDEITAHYTGYFLDGEIFDITDLYPVSFTLGLTIDGWREGIPLLKPGGKGKLLIPSGLGYANNPPSGFRKNAVLGFDVELIEDLAAYEEEKIQAYLDDKGLVSQTTASGIHYIIEEEGTGDEHPTLNDNVAVFFKGYYLDEEIFDQTQFEPVTFSLNDVIDGWQESIQLLKKDGKGTFLIPSDLAYGKNPPQGIPQNATMVFEIELVDF